MARQCYLFTKALALLTIGGYLLLTLEDGTVLGGVVALLTGGGAGLIAGQLLRWDRRQGQYDYYFE